MYKIHLENEIGWGERTIPHQESCASFPAFPSPVCVLTPAPVGQALPCHLPVCIFCLEQWNKEWGLEVVCSKVCCCFHLLSWGVPAQSDPRASVQEMALCPAQSLLWPGFYHEWCGIKSLMYLAAFIELESNQSSWIFMLLSPKTRIRKATWKKLHYLSAVWVIESLRLEKSFKIRVQHCPVAHKPRPQVPHLRVLNPSKNSCLNVDLGICFWG